MVCAVLAIIKLGFDDMRLGVVDEVKFGELVEPYLYSRQDTICVMLMAGSRKILGNNTMG